MYYFKRGQYRPLFVYFCPFLVTISIIQIVKILDGVLGIKTWGRRIVSADETIELEKAAARYTPYLFDFLADQFVHHLLLKSFRGSPFLVGTSGCESTIGPCILRRFVKL